MSNLNFCSCCGASVELIVPSGDTRIRHVCIACHTVHYQNPRIVAGCLVTHENRVMLCKRGIEPRAGYWTFPAGFQELGETTSECATRETVEESNAAVELVSLYALYDLPYISQVYLFYRARLVSDFEPGLETIDVRLFEEHQIPWNELAFPAVAETLAHYLEDRKSGKFEIHVEILSRTLHLNDTSSPTQA